MPIDKIIPRSLNRDDDYLTVKSVEMIDALNVNISSDDDGNAGVIKNTWGNTKVAIRQGDALPAGTNRVVGSCVNREKNEILFAVFNSNNNHSLYWYGVEAQQVRLVIRDSVLAFKLDSYVKMDTIVKENGDTLLYFNDTETDPKKVNITKALTKTGYPYKELTYLDEFGAPVTYSYTPEERLLSLTVAKQPPLEPPVVAFASDPSVTFNRLYDNHFQFACQYIYEDGEVSAISPWSENPVNSSQLLDSLTDRDQSTFNRINITFKRNLGDVAKIRVLAKRYLNNSFFVVKEVANQRSILVTTETIGFYNDEGHEYIGERETNKLFDSVPIYANAQALVSNRLIYGANNESYDNVAVDADVSFNYNLIDSSPLITVTPSTAINVTSTAGAGFLISIDLSLIPSASLSPIDIIIDIYPESRNLRINDPFVDVSTGTSRDFFELANFKFNARKSVYVQSYTNRSQVAAAIQAELVGEYSGLFNGPWDYAPASPQFYRTTGSSVVSLFYESYNSTTNIVSFRFAVKSVFVEIFNQALGAFARQINKDVFLITQNANNYLVKNSTSIFIESAYRGFKIKQEHSIGVVYYDGRNRSGAVNKIGSFSPAFTGPFSPSLVYPSLGSAGLNVRVKGTAPSWAKKWQLVYSPFMSYSFVYQYAASEAFTTQTEVSFGSKPIYVSLRHLEGKEDSYKESSGAIFNYSYVKGDRLRIISYVDSTGTRVYPQSIDFEINGLEVFETNTILFPFTSSGDVRRTGIFLSLKEGDYAGWTAEDIYVANSLWHRNVIFEIYRPAFSSENAVYHEIGESHPVVFDGSVYRHGGQRDYRYSVPFQLPQNFLNVSAGKATSAVDLRNGDQLVIALDPSTQASVTVGTIFEEGSGNYFFYTTVGNGSYRILSISNVSDAVVTTFNGDCYNRPRNIKMNPVNPTTQAPIPTDVSVYYERIYVEDSSISDFYQSNFIGIGRANAISKDAKNVFRKASISYSDAYALDTSILGLSSFNGSEANFVDLQAQHGAIKYIATNSDSIIVLQETKCSVLPVSRNTIEYLDGGAGVTVSNVFLGQQSFYAGDYGVGNHPESVAEFYGKIFFADHRNGKVVRISADGIELISEQGMDSFFQSIFEDLNRLGSQNFKIYGGIDPRNKEYVISIQKISGSFSFENQTVGYSIDDKVWTSRYSYMPETVTEINGGQYTFKAGEMYVHSVSSPMNTFYGSFTPSKVSIIASSNSSMVKHFEAISTESTAPWSFKAFTSVNLGLTDTSRQETAVVLASSMTKKEGFYYHEIPTDSLAVVPYMLGTVISVAGATGGLAVKVGSPVNSLPLPLGALVYKVVSGAITPTTYTLSGISQRDTVLIAGTGPILANDVLAVASDSDVDGEKLRGPYVRIDLENGLTTPHETYAFNVWFTRSGMHNELVN